jgi:hypothetical protein
VIVHLHRFVAADIVLQKNVLRLDVAMDVVLFVRMSEPHRYVLKRFDEFLFVHQRWAFAKRPGGYGHTKPIAILAATESRDRVVSSPLHQ